MTAIDDVKAKLKTKLTSIANSVREKTGTEDLLTLDEMKAGVDYLPSSTDDNTFILVDENGNEVPAVLTKNEVDLTATANDIREGIVAVTDDGVIEGTKEIPSYYTVAGYRVITKGSQLFFVHRLYDYTEMQAVICLDNTKLANSTAVTKVVISDTVYDVYSTTPISTIVKDDVNNRVNLGIKNESDKPYIIRYFMYKEMY